MRKRRGSGGREGRQEPKAPRAVTCQGPESGKHYRRPNGKCLVDLKDAGGTSFTHACEESHCAGVPLALAINPALPHDVLVGGLAPFLTDADLRSLNAVLGVPLLDAVAVERARQGLARLDVQRDRAYYMSDTARARLGETPCAWFNDRQVGPLSVDPGERFLARMPYGEPGLRYHHVRGACILEKRFVACSKHDRGLRSHVRYNVATERWGLHLKEPACTCALHPLQAVVMLCHLPKKGVASLRAWGSPFIGRTTRGDFAPAILMRDPEVVAALRGDCNVVKSRAIASRGGAFVRALGELLSPMSVALRCTIARGEAILPFAFLAWPNFTPEVAIFSGVDRHPASCTLDYRGPLYIHATEGVWGFHPPRCACGVDPHDQVEDARDQGRSKGWFNAHPQFTRGNKGKVTFVPAMLAADLRFRIAKFTPECGAKAGDAFIAGYRAHIATMPPRWTAHIHAGVATILFPALMLPGIATDPPQDVESSSGFTDLNSDLASSSSDTDSMGG
jgi:hypothetical protein